MIRVVLAAVLSLALLAVALPAVDDARADRAAATATRELDRVAGAAAALRRSSDPVVSDLVGARRVRHLSVPAPGPGTVGVGALALGGRPNGTVPADGPRSDVLTYRLPGGRARVAAVLPVDLRVRRDGRLLSDDTPAVLRDDAVVSLGYVRRAGRPVVTVSLGRGREFKYRNGTTPDHGAT